MIKGLFRMGVVALGFLATASLLSAAPLPPLDLAGVREAHTMIPMRDGVRLSAYLYTPPGEGRWPAVFEQRYAGLTAAGTRRAAADLARAGFVVAMVNYRGAHLSEGRWQGYRALQWGELRDGYDVCEWLAAQPWCTGKVGTFGGSQGGYAQNYLAVTQPPHLFCQYMTDTGMSLFHEGYRIGGVTRPERFEAYGSVARDPADHDALLREWDAHPHYDDYWRAEDATLHFEKMKVPCFTVGSWYDFMVQGSIGSFIGRRPHAAPQQLVLGPWLHGRLNKTNKVGELVFPENAKWPELGHMTRWFNRWLKDERNGVENDPPVRYYVMGVDEWRTAQDWPPAADRASYFLHEDGALSTAQSAQESARTSYRSDPRQPMSIPGTAFPGAKDARPFEQQSEVRAWTTEPLREPVEWTGEVTAELFISSSARDTDFIVRVSDVYPDGRSMLLMDYPMRARYREGFDRQALLTPGEIVRLPMHVGWTSIVFARGHRIRVTIASTGAPLYEPNNQTGGPQTRDWMKESVAAINSIWHDRAHASRIVAPVVGAQR